MTSKSGKVGFCEAVSEFTSWTCLAYGNNRAVFSLGDGTVIKFNFPGYDIQSKREICRWENASEKERAGLLPLLTYDKDGAWIVVPKVPIISHNKGLWKGNEVLIDYGGISSL